MNNHPTRSRLLRHEALRRIVRATNVASQDELSRLLARDGFRVAQPTLSRDVREVGLVKGPEGYALPGEVPAAGDDEQLVRRRALLDQALRDYATSVTRAASLVVVKTPVAEASPLARALDQADLPGAVGTVAGDDTIFVATTGTAAAERLAKRLLSPIRPKTSRRPRA